MAGDLVALQRQTQGMAAVLHVPAVLLDELGAHGHSVALSTAEHPLVLGFHLAQETLNRLLGQEFEAHLAQLETRRTVHGLGGSRRRLRESQPRHCAASIRRRGRQRSRIGQAEAYRDAHAAYCRPTEGLDGVTVAPFQILAAEGRALAPTEPHSWHLAQLSKLDGDLITPTRHRFVDLNSAEQRAEASAGGWISPAAGERAWS